MKKIPLTQGKFALVDDCDYDYLILREWQYGSDGYAVHSVGVNGAYQKILMHRVILERMGHRNFARSDHINRRRKLDNCRSNLRPATASQSCCNRGKFSNNTSGYTGVHRITKNGK